ncbi:MAG: T9SS type A sorting domain-containing protein [Chitinophagales bacterium]|nr:T9SS type A sorting domain-containing protein [Chitinophagales bacterium]
MDAKSTLFYQKAFLIICILLSSLQAKPFTFLEMIVASGQYECGKPVIFIPNGLQNNLGNVRVLATVTEGDLSSGNSVLFEDTLLLEDTTYFEYLGSIVFDPTDSIKSLRHGYRWKYENYTISSGSLGSVELLVTDSLTEESYFYTQSFMKSCANCGCVSRMATQLYYAIALSSKVFNGPVPYSGYSDQYGDLSSYNQEVVATIFNWLLNKNATVADYLDLFDPNNISKQIPGAFCDNPIEFSCEVQRDLAAWIRQVDTLLIDLGPDAIEDYYEFQFELIESAFTQCAAEGYYFPLLTTTDTLEGYSLLLLPLKSNLPVINSQVIFHDSVPYVATAYSDQMTFEQGLKYTGYGSFEVINGYNYSLVDEGDSALGYPIAPFSGFETIGDQSEICQGDTAHLWVEPAPFDILTWFTGSEEDTIIVTDYSSHAVVLDSSGCITVSSEFALTVKEIPTAIAGADTMLCYGDTIQLDGSNSLGVGLAYPSYAWAPNLFIDDSTSSTPLVFPDSTTAYVLTVLDINGCDHSDTLTVFVPSTDTLYWVGRDDSLWHNAANWSYKSGGMGGCIMPDSTSTVIFDHAHTYPCYLDTATKVTNIEIDSLGEFYLGGNGFEMLGNYIQRGGVFDGGNNSIVIHGSTFVNMGDFYATTGILTLYKEFIQDSGQFTHNNGTVIFKDSALVSITDTFYNLEFTDSIVVTLLKDLKVANALDLNDASLLTKGNKLLLLDSSNTALSANTKGNVSGSYAYLPLMAQWKLGASTQTFTLPFKDLARGNIPIEVDIVTAGTGSSGKLEFAIYAVDSTKYPAVPGISLNDAQGIDQSSYVANRFWEIDYSGYSANPSSTVVLTYSDTDLVGTLVQEGRLKAQLWDGSNWQSPTGIVDTINNTITLHYVDKSGIWALVDSTATLYQHLKVVAHITDQKTVTPSTGSVTLEIFGGKQPYNLVWDNSSTSLTRSGLSAGTYAFTVTDANSDTLQSSVEIVYQPIWEIGQNVTTTGNSITKTNSGSDFDGIVNSVNYLQSNQDGFLEFTATTSNGETYFIGLTESATDPQQMEYSYLVDEDYIYIYESGNQVGNYGNHLGHSFRISRLADSIYYYRDTLLMRATAGNAGKTLGVFAGLGKYSPTIDSIRVSFKNPLGLAITSTDLLPTSPSSGGITVKVRGGASPYTVHWSDGPSTSLTRTGLPIGTYTVTVIDNANDTVQATATLGYKILWKDTVGVSVTPNSVTKTSTSADFDAGAVSINYLKGNEDGFVEFRITEATDRQFFFGLSENNFGEDEQTIEYAFARMQDQAFIYESGRAVLSAGTVSSGDILRIERDNDSIKYYRNGSLLHTSKDRANEELRLDVSLGANEPTIPNIRSSFGIPFGLSATITDAWPTQTTSGSIQLEVQGGTAPYSFNWSTGGTASLLDSINAGSYSVTATDDNGDSIVAAYQVGYRIFWQNTANVNTTGNSITKTSPSISWNAGGSSMNYLKPMANGYLEMTMASSELHDERSYLGFSSIDTTLATSGIGYAFALSQATLSIYENGLNKGSFGKLDIGDKIRIERIGDTIRYTRNGTVLKNTIVNATRPLFIDASLGANKPNLDYLKTNIGDVNNLLTLYWVGADDSLWNNAANWSYFSGGAGGAGIPDSFRTVIFDGYGNSACHLDVHATVKGLFMDSTYTDSLYLHKKLLTINNDLNIAGGHLITSDTVLTIKGGISISGGTLRAGSDTLKCLGGFLQTGGGFQGVGAYVYVHGNLEINGGSFTATEKTTHLYANFTGTPGTFVANGGTVLLHNDATLNVRDAFFALTLSDSIRASMLDTLTVSHRLSLNYASTLVPNGKPVHIASGDTLAISASSGAGILQVGSDFSAPLRWDIGNHGGTFRVPFRTPAGEDVGIDCHVTSTGTGSGHLLIATYATNANYFPINNQPVPAETQAWFDTASIDKTLFSIDRFYSLQANGFSTEPGASLTMRYTDTDLLGQNMVSEDSLVAERWNGSTWVKQQGTVDAGDNKFTLAGSDYGIFVLSDSVTSPYATGTSCADAIEINDTLELRTFIATDSIIWFKFLATDSLISLILSQVEQYGFYVDSMLLYEGDCDDMVLLASAAQNDSAFQIQYSGSLLDTVYYLKVIKGYRANSFLSFAPRVFCLTPINICAVCDGSDISGDDFSTNPPIENYEQHYCQYPLTMSYNIPCDTRIPQLPTLLKYYIYPHGTSPTPGANVTYGLVRTVSLPSGTNYAFATFSTVFSLADLLSFGFTIPGRFDAYVYFCEPNGDGIASSPIISFNLDAPTTVSRLLDINPNPLCGGNGEIEIECLNCDPNYSYILDYTINGIPLNYYSTPTTPIDLDNYITGLPPYTFEICVSEENACGIGQGCGTVVYTPLGFEYEIICNSSTSYTVNFGANCGAPVWNFGDGSPSVTGSQVQHTYTNITGGISFPITLTYSGQTLVEYITIHPIQVPALTAAIQPACTAGTQVTYTLSNYNSGFSYVVSSCTGCSQTMPMVISNSSFSLTWQSGAGGSFTVTADEGGDCEQQATFIVPTCCDDGFTITGPNTDCAQPVILSLTNSVAGFTYTWNISSGNFFNVNGTLRNSVGTASNGTVTLVLNNPPYMVTVTSSSGCTDPVTFSIEPCCFAKEAVNWDLWDYILFDTDINTIAQNRQALFPCGSNPPHAIPNQSSHAFNVLPMDVTGSIWIVNTSQEIVVNGELIINHDVQFLNCNIFRIAPNARIIVQAPHILSLSSTFGYNTLSCAPETHLESSTCGAMWDGIYVEPGATLVVNGAIIQDAENAVVVERNGRVLSRNRATYLNNYQDMVFNNHRFNVPGPHASVIESSIFDGASLLIAPRSGQTKLASITANNMSSLNIGSNMLVANRFQNVQTAIAINNSGANIENNWFLGHHGPQGIVTGIACSTGTVDLVRIGRLNPNFTFLPNQASNYFTDCITGISATGQQNLIVDRNLIGRTPTGIRITNSPVVNTFAFTSQITITSNQIEQSQEAITLINSKVRTLVRDNLVVMPSTGVTTTGITLLDAVSTGLPWTYSPYESRVENNTVSNAALGIIVGNKRRHFTQFNNVTLRNMGSATTTGIWQSGNANASTFCNDVTGLSQPSVDGTMFGMRTINCNGSGFGFNQVATLGRGFLFEQQQIAGVIANDMINTITGLALGTQGSIGPQGSAGQPTDNRWFGSITNHLRNYGSAPQGNNKFWRRGGYGSNYDPGSSFVTVPTAGLFIPSQATTASWSPWAATMCNPSGSNTVQKTMPLEYMLAIVADTIAYDEDSLTYKWWDQYNLYQTLQGEDSLLQAEPVLDSFMKAYGNSAYAQLEGLRYEVEKLEADTFDLNRYNDLRAEIGKVITANDIEDNMKTYLDLYVQVLKGVGVNELEGMIQQLAEECAFYGGPSVLDARVYAISKDLSLASYEWEDSCTGGSYKLYYEASTEQKPLTTEVPKPDYRLIPNLFNGERSARIVIANSEQGAVDIYAMDGHLINDYKLKEGANNIMLPQGMSKGVYIYKVTINNEYRATGKLVIVN